MKNPFIFTLLVLTILNSCSSKKHLEFENIPVSGKLDTFTLSLLKSGFIETHPAKENQQTFEGIYLEKYCTIEVFATNKSRTVYKVRVNMPKVKGDSLKPSFESIQRIFTDRYGNGKSRYKQYKNPKRLLFNEPGIKRVLKRGDNTTFTTIEGKIRIEVQDGYVSITYLNTVNNEIRKKETDEFQLQISH
jgi:hypothetical protein